MANKPLQSLTFPGLSDTYTVPQLDTTLTQAGSIADAKKVGDEISNLKDDLNSSIKFEPFVNGVVLKKGHRTLTKNIAANTTQVRYWEFAQDYLGNELIEVSPQGTVHIYYDIEFPNPSGKIKTCSVQYAFYQADGTTMVGSSYYTVVYSRDNVDERYHSTITVPNNNAIKYLKILSLYETFEGVTDAFTETINVNGFLVANSNIKIDEVLLQNSSPIDQTARDNISTLTGRIDAQDLLISNATGRIDAQDLLISDTTVRLDTLSGTVTTHGNDITSLEQETTSLDKDLSHVELGTPFLNGIITHRINGIYDLSYGPTVTQMRLWTFRNFINDGEMIRIDPTKPIVIAADILFDDPNNLIQSVTYQCSFYAEDKTTKIGNTFYTPYKDKQTVIGKPGGNAAYVDIVLYVTLTQAPGETYVIHITIDHVIISQELLEPSNRLIVSDVERAFEQPKKNFSFVNGKYNVNGPDSVTTCIRTDLIPLDFKEAYVDAIPNKTVRIVEFDANKTYVRRRESDFYIPEGATVYFALEVVNNDGSNISPLTFDPSSLHFRTCSFSTLTDVISKKPRFVGANVYRSELASGTGKYWVYNDTDGYYLDERVMDIMSSSGVPLLFITDTHWRTNSSSKFSWDICGFIAERCHCNTIIFGGDALTQHASTEAGIKVLKQEVWPFVNRFGTDFKYVFGNHDANLANVGSQEAADASIINYENIYKICCQHQEDYVNFEQVEYDKGSEEWYRSRLHYYWDDLVEHIRYIVLDSGTRYDALGKGGSPARLRYQYDWLVDVLKATPPGYHIMVITHMFWNIDTTDPDNPTYADATQGNSVAKILSAYVNKTTVHIGATVEAGNTYNYDFTDGIANPIICMLSGHTHIDAIFEKEGIVNVITTCDAIDHTTHPGTEMTAGTTTEHAFDVFKIDRYSRKVKIFRIGAGNDREFTY